MKSPEKRIKLPYIDAEKVADEIGDFIFEYTRYFGGVIGLSGGIDSTVTAALTKRAYRKYFNPHDGEEELVGYILPSKLNSKADEQDAIKVAEKLMMKYEIISIEQRIEAARTTNPEVFEDNKKARYNKGNMISRIRADVLHTKSATENKYVIGTGNKDEDFGIGYYTLFGDGAAHLSPIAGLSKRLVRQMAVYLGFEEMANRTPSAGLEPSQTDFKDLGYSYDLVELVNEGLAQGFKIMELEKHSQVREVAERDKKNYTKLYGKSLFSDLEYMINDVYMRKGGAEFKLSILHPPSPKITLEYR